MGSGSFIVDQNGNVAAITDYTASARQTRSMAYDGLDRLTGTTSPMFGTATYAYDTLDNLNQVTVSGGNTPRNHYYCYDATTRRLDFVRSGPVCTGTASPAVTTLGYDVQGNLGNKNGTTYTFDYGNRLRSTAGLTYRYDAEGRRVRQDNSGTQLKYSYYAKDGRLLWQRDEVASKRISNVYFAGSLVAEYSRPIGSGTVTVNYLHTDAAGSPIAKTNSAGAVIETSEYEPYGKLLNRANDDRAGYTGHVMDAASGLTYMQQRYYDPQIGRFLSVDPVTANAAGGTNFNRYWYANNNPYKFIDPDGRQARTGGSHPTEDREERLRKLPPPPPPPKPVAAQSSPTAKPPQQSNVGFSAKGLLVGKPSVTATGMAAVGGGIQATKGLYNADSSVGIVTPAVALTASADVNLITLSYTASDKPQAPVGMKFGLSAEGHAPFGGRVSLGYTPPATFEISLDGGVGAGVGFHFYEVNAVLKEE